MPRPYRICERDSNEALIVKLLRAHGAIVQPVNDYNFPDLCVGYRGVITLLEVKRPLGPRGGVAGKGLRPGQREFFELWAGRGLPVHVVRSPEEALRAIGIT